MTAPDLERQLIELEKLANQAFNKVETSESLENLRLEYLGQKGELTAVLRGLSTLDKSERPRIGQLANTVKEKIQSLYELRKTSLYSLDLEKRLKSEQIDITLPGRERRIGHIHPLTQITQEIIEILFGMGFSVVDGPEIDTDYYNFDALNTPVSHPARDEQDTFYTDFDPSVLLRSHVSTMQVRAMEKMKLPLKIMYYGRVYRNEEVNARKYPLFHQMETLYVDENVTFGQMKSTLNEFIRLLFGRPLKTRLRPDFFPFTEPSAELDSECPFCSGSGCRTCGGKGWLELLGCGMVDPNVLKAANVDPDKWNGFAFGMGIERFAMLKYGISDIRNFYTNDLRFLEQF